ncbi:hypothetical protein [Arthrobacter psychrolactophilus]
MFPWMKRDTVPALPPAAIPRAGGIPWHGDGLSAVDVDLPHGRKGTRLIHCVQLSVGEFTVEFMFQEVLDLLKGRAHVVDPMGREQDVFLCNAQGVNAAATAGKASEAGAWMASFPADALVITRVPPTEPPVIVIPADTVESLAAWLQKQPK